MSTLTETIAADQQAVADAQATLDAANKKLADDQAAADAATAAAAPHLSVYAKFEAAAAKYGAEAQAEFATIIAEGRALFGL